MHLWRAIAIASVLALACAASAQATVSVAVSGATLTVTGSSGPDTPKFSYYDAAAGQPGYTRIFNYGPGGGVADPVPPCYRPSTGGAPADAGEGPGNTIPQTSSDVAFCEDGGTATFLTNLVVNLGGGDDQPDWPNACFNTVTLDQGEGTNQVNTPACPSGTFTVTSGAGADTMTADTGGAMAIIANLGGGDDSFTGGDGNDTAHGGEGHDLLHSSNGNDQNFGDGGADEINGGAGNDVEDGGPGDDKIGHIGPQGAPRDDDQGADTVRGGDGTDLLTLDGHTGGMTINLNGLPDDGAAAEGDNIGSDFERITASRGNDTFFGTPGPDTFEGGPGNDEAHGAGGNDDIDGSNGDDRIYGDAGDDKVQGGVATDVVDGGSGRDQIWADIANCNVYSCSAAADELFAQDGEQDSVDCGGGAGIAHVDQLDLVAFCTNIDKKSVGSEPDPKLGPGNDTTAPVATLLRLTPSAFKTLATGTGRAAAGGARISYTLSEPATVRFAVRRIFTGRKSGNRCVRKTAKNKGAKRCRFSRLVSGNFAHTGAAGANTLRFSGRLGGRRLVAGSYRLTGTPTDAAGNAGKSVSANFSIRKR